jgi:branched-chain amino acid transport system ATP-binding protein
MGMTLLNTPRLLLLDEPSLGLAPFLVERIMDEVREIATERRTAVLLVEQNVGQALRVADRAYVLRTGQVIAAERADELARRERLWELF